jgi:hypothetical protein
MKKDKFPKMRGKNVVKSKKVGFIELFSQLQDHFYPYRA